MAEPARRRLVLASASPFRRRMLEAAGLSFEVAPADVDEAALKRDLLGSGSTPSTIAAALAAAKADAVSARLPDALVIGADQVLALGQDLFSKPVGTPAAREQLLRLRGKSHQLHTAACLATGGKAVWTHVEIATLTMRPFSDAFLADYLRVAGDRVCHTVGAYEIEGLGIQLFERIEGSLFTIIGLPLLPLLAELRARGVIDA
ncbi:MAG: septum formation inhibitor Maf [Alphaproteobacteria bacterium]|jgi:septum formation protein|nr:MAG: septum formation inhibitor Maf [Alphaproteobacteria bacterium]